MILARFSPFLAVPGRAIGIPGVLFPFPELSGRSKTLVLWGGPQGGWGGFGLKFLGPRLNPLLVVRGYRRLIGEDGLWMVWLGLAL